MASQELRVWFEFIEINEFSERYPTTKSKKKHQSPQERTESPETGREEKTRKMIREAKIITRPSLPAPVPGKPNFVEDDISILCPVASIHNFTDIWYSGFCIA